MVVVVGVMEVLEMVGAGETEVEVNVGTFAGVVEVVG